MGGETTCKMVQGKWIAAEKCAASGDGDSCESAMPSSTTNGHAISMDTMSMGCGAVESASVKEFMNINHLMHSGMAIKFSCSHDIDFVRGMIPHHAGAVGMCQTLHSHSTNPDAYLVELCANITRLQRAEIAWMSQWLENRGHKRTAPCEVCAEYTEPDMPCEDMLPSTSFCHRLGGDFMCKCESAVSQYACDSKEEVPGFGVLDITAECQRTCGKCPAVRPPLFHTNKCMSGHGGHEGHGGHGGHEGHSHSHEDHKDHTDHKGHGDTGGHTKGVPTASGSDGQTSTEIPAKKMVSMVLTMKGLGYDKLIADTDAVTALRKDLKTSVLANLPNGYTEDHIKITFSKGSVKATIDITPLSDSDAAILKTTVNDKKESINKAALQQLKAMPNVNALLEDGKTAEDLTVTSTAAAEMDINTNGNTEENTKGESSLASASQSTFVALSVVGGLLLKAATQH